jgi:hypothetical protein
MLWDGAAAVEPRLKVVGPEEAVVLPKTILLAVGAWRFTRDDLADAILRWMHSLAEGGQPLQSRA